MWIIIVLMALSEFPSLRHISYLDLARSTKHRSLEGIAGKGRRLNVGGFSRLCVFPPQALITPPFHQMVVHAQMHMVNGMQSHSMLAKTRNTR